MVLSSAWLPAIWRYLAIIAAATLGWETAQMPLYTLWRTGTTAAIAFAVLHCTGGDALIAGASLLGSLLLFGAADWPHARFRSVAVATIILGTAYTIYSEHLNTARNAWTYSDRMPVLPGLGTGLAPLAQWVVVPVLAFCAMRSAARREFRAPMANKGLDLPIIGSPTSGSGSGNSSRSSRRVP